MDLRVLRYFIVVAQEGNITKAADILHITQPTLSRQLMKLEEDLGTTLFTRGKRQITLTDDGHLLYQRAQELLGLADKTKREFSQRKDTVSGVISIGLVESNASELIADWINEFSKQYPNVTFDLYNGYGDDIKMRIDQGLIDIGLLLEPIEIAKYSFIHLPKKDTWGVLMYGDNPLAKEEKLHWNELVSEPLILPERTIIHGEMMNWFGVAPHELRVIATYNLLSNAVYLVENAHASAVCLDGAIAVRHHSKNTTFIPLTPNHSAGSVLVWKKDYTFNTVAELFLQTIKMLLEHDE